MKSFCFQIDNQNWPLRVTPASGQPPPPKNP
jgi:hypothetical protein